jgi:hypothetical protein
VYLPPSSPPLRSLLSSKPASAVPQPPPASAASAAPAALVPAPAGSLASAASRADHWEVEPGEEAIALLRQKLNAKRGRVLDLFRQWDENGDGGISRDEFGRGLLLCRLTFSAADARKLFDIFDEDGSGWLDFQEMDRMLRQASYLQAERTLPDPCPALVWPLLSPRQKGACGPRRVRRVCGACKVRVRRMRAACDACAHAPRRTATAQGAYRHLPQKPSAALYS